MKHGVVNRTSTANVTGHVVIAGLLLAGKLAWATGDNALRQATPSPMSPVTKTLNPAPLTLSGSTELPGYKGDFDHFAIDDKDGVLFLAGEESAELEAFDVNSGALRRRLKGFGVPHSLLYMPASNELLVIDGEKPSKVLDATTLTSKRAYALAAGADSIGFDQSSGHLWVVTGGKDVPQKDSNLIEIDAATGKVLANVHFDADHVEAMAIEQSGRRLFINVTDKNELVTVDRKSGKILSRRTVKEAQQNAPLAYDEANQRLFVVTRKPGMLVIINANSGATIGQIKAPERTDQVIWDAANRRIYVTGGEGYISVVEQDDADHYRETARIKSLPGAKTAILDSQRAHLWVAASPGDTGQMGKVLRFNVAKR